MSPDPLERVIEVAMWAADRAALDAPFHSRTRDVKTAVTEAFRMARSNGLIEVVPQDRWPGCVMLDPPYRLHASDGA